MRKRFQKKMKRDSPVTGCFCERRRAMGADLKHSECRCEREFLCYARVVTELLCCCVCAVLFSRAKCCEASSLNGLAYVGRLPMCARKVLSLRERTQLHFEEQPYCLRQHGGSAGLGPCWAGPRGPSEETITQSKKKEFETPILSERRPMPVAWRGGWRCTTHEREENRHCAPPSPQPGKPTSSYVWNSFFSSSCFHSSPSPTSLLALVLSAFPR